MRESRSIKQGPVRAPLCFPIGQSEGDFASLGASPLENSVQKFPDSGVRPCGWTKSSWRFDRLPGVLILELRRAEIA